MSFAPFHITRWVHGATLVSEPDLILDEALRRATNVRLDRTLGIIESRPGWTAKTLAPLTAAVNYLSRLFLRNGTIYNYAQVGTILQRLSSTWAAPVTIANPGAQIVSDANSPDGNGHLFKYFVNDSIAFKDDGGTLSSVMGIPPPTAAPLGATLATDLFTQIDHMDVAANWTGSSLSSGPNNDTNIWNGVVVSATATIGSGANGTTTVSVQGVQGNTWTITVVIAAGINQPLSAAFVGTAMTVTLGTDGAGAPDPVKNTALLVAAAINGTLSLMSAVAGGSGLTPLTVAEGPTALTGGSGGSSVAFAIVASTFGSIAQFLGSEINLDTLAGGDDDVKDDDYIYLWIRADRPERITFLQIDVDVDASSTAIADCFRHNYYSIRLGALTTLSQGRDQWTEVQIRKASFARYGTDVDRDWSNARGFRIGFLTNTLETVTLFVDDFKLRGGVGIEGDIEYTVCYRNSNTGARGNPPKDADGIVLYTDKITTNRQRINLNITNVVQGGAAHPGETQIDTMMIWRRGGTFTTAALVDTILDATVSPFLDNFSDFLLVLTDKFLETDNDQPPSGASRVLFGPDATGHFFMIVDGFRLYFSKPYEDKENRVENWPALAYGLIGDGSSRALAGAASGTQVRAWTRERAYNVVGAGEETFLPVSLDGTRGIVGQHAHATGDGVFFTVAQDGIYADVNGKQTKLTSAIDPFFQGLTVDEQVGLGVPPDTTRLAFLPDPKGSLLVMSYPGGFLALKPNLQDSKLTECFFGISALTQIESLYLDAVNRELLAGGTDGHVYRIEDPGAYSDNGTALAFTVRSKSYDLGQPQHGKLVSSAEVEGNTNGQSLTLTAYYDRAAISEGLGAVITTSETAVYRVPIPDPTVARRDIALQLTGSVTERVAITRLGCMYEAQPEALPFLDSGKISFDFKQQLKRFEVDIQLVENAAMTVYADDVAVFTGVFVAKVTRVNEPYFLPAGIRGRVFRVTLLSDGANFLCYKWSGFFKQLGTDQAYTEKVLIQGV